VRRITSPVLVLWLCLVTATCAAAQNANAGFPDTEDGLKQFLTQTIARANNHRSLVASVKSTEIPNFVAFFRITYPGPGDSWIGPYGSGLQQNDERIEGLLTFLSHVDGEVFVRKLVDDPNGDHGMEWGMLTPRQARLISTMQVGVPHPSHHSSPATSSLDTSTSSKTASVGTASCELPTIPYTARIPSTLTLPKRVIRRDWCF
jgi:hypothetical protein